MNFNVDFFPRKVTLLRFLAKSKGEKPYTQFSSEI